jgi:hypothetical protein
MLPWTCRKQSLRTWKGYLLFSSSSIKALLRWLKLKRSRTHSRVYQTISVGSTIVLTFSPLSSAKQTIRSRLQTYLLCTTVSPQTMKIMPQVLKSCTHLLPNEHTQRSSFEIRAPALDQGITLVLNLRVIRVLLGWNSAVIAVNMGIVRLFVPGFIEEVVMTLGRVLHLRIHSKAESRSLTPSSIMSSFRGLMPHKFSMLLMTSS